MYYNFAHIHQTLKMTPAMVAGVTSRLWEMGDIVNVPSPGAKTRGWPHCRVSLNFLSHALVSPE
jgi:hypothetical protein